MAETSTYVFVVRGLTCVAVTVDHVRGVTYV